MKLKKLRDLTIENLYNLGVYQIMDISWVLYNAYVIFRHRNEFLFHVSNYID